MDCYWHVLLGLDKGYSEPFQTFLQNSGKVSQHRHCATQSTCWTSENCEVGCIFFNAQKYLNWKRLSHCNAYPVQLYCVGKYIRSELVSAGAQYWITWIMIGSERSYLEVLYAGCECLWIHIGWKLEVLYQYNIWHRYRGLQWIWNDILRPLTTLSYIYINSQKARKYDWTILLLNSSVKILLSMVPDISVENNLFF